MEQNKKSVCGICYKHKNLKKYILWALKLLEDMPALFDRIAFTDKPQELASGRSFDIYIVDDVSTHTAPNGTITIHMKNTVSGDQELSELELLAKSGFLSIVGLTQVALGAAHEVQSFPQQPTNNLMFYYVHSLMTVTRILLAIHEKAKTPKFDESPHLYENIAVDNLIFLCQGVFRMRDIGLWNNEQGQNLLDGGAPFYSIYKAKDNAYFTVACIEQKFYKIFLQLLRSNNLNEKEY